jgi:hypothetical protein
MNYSHRNGETEPPTVPGWYWVQRVKPFIWGRVLKMDLYHDEDTEYLYVEDDEGREFRLPDAFGNDSRWWGPLMPPWDDNA